MSTVVLWLRLASLPLLPVYCVHCPENNQALNVSSSAHFDATCIRQISFYTYCSIVDFFPAVDDLPGNKEHSCAPVRIISFCLMSSFGFQLPDVI